MSRLRPSLHALGVALGLLAAPAGAQPTVSELEVVAPKSVEELVVTATPKCLRARTRPTAPPPRLIESFPAPGAAVKPGVLVLRLTFDRPMTCEGFLEAAGSVPNPCPTDRQHMSQSFDRKTFWVLCTAEPATDYAVRLGGRHPFRSLDGQGLEPRALTFRTSDGAPAATIPEALAQDDFPPNRRHLSRR